jgi:hypothetical protein
MTVDVIMIIILISAVLVFMAVHAWAKRRVRRDVDAALRRECGRRFGTLRCEAPAGHGGWHYDGEAGVFWPGREDVQR